jgi:hypothetical protein
LNVDLYPELKTKYGISLLPMFRLFRIESKFAVQGEPFHNNFNRYIEYFNDLCDTNRNPDGTLNNLFGTNAELNNFTNVFLSSKEADRKNIFLNFKKKFEELNSQNVYLYYLKVFENIDTKGDKYVINEKNRLLNLIKSVKSNIDIKPFEIKINILNQFK